MTGAPAAPGQGIEIAFLKRMMQNTLFNKE